MKNAKSYVMVFAAALLWGAIGIFVNELSAYGIATRTVAAFRLFVGASLLVPVLVVMGLRGETGKPQGRPGAFSMFRIPLRSFLACALIGLLGFALSNWSYYESIKSVGMSTAAILLYTSPLFGMAFGRMFFGEAITKQKLIGLVINICGSVLAVTSGDLSSVSFSVYGVAMGVLGGFTGALLAVFSSIATEKAHALSVAFWGLMIGGLVLMGASFPWQDVRAVLCPRLMLLLFGFGLIPTAVSYALYMRGLSGDVETSKVPVICSVETVVTVCVGALAYAEVVGPIKLLGIVLVIASIVVMNAGGAETSRNGLFDAARTVEPFDPVAWKVQKDADIALLHEQLAAAAGNAAGECAVAVQGVRKPWSYIR